MILFTAFSFSYFFLLHYKGPRRDTFKVEDDIAFHIPSLHFNSPTGLTYLLLESILQPSAISACIIQM